MSDQRKEVHYRELEEKVYCFLTGFANIGQKLWHAFSFQSSSTYQIKLESPILNLSFQVGENPLLLPPEMPTGRIIFYLLFPLFFNQSHIYMELECCFLLCWKKTFRKPKMSLNQYFLMSMIMEMLWKCGIFLIGTSETFGNYRSISSHHNIEVCSFYELKCGKSSVWTPMQGTENVTSLSSTMFMFPV